MASLLAAPAYIWNLYIDYLWNYDSNSWVATIAYFFRIWSILAIIPTILLGSLDVTSYVIARTLGDPTAATSHKAFAPEGAAPAEAAPAAFPTTEEDGASRLAGVGVFSPVASEPGSPTLRRRQSIGAAAAAAETPSEESEGAESGQHGHARVASGAGGSTSGEESFALLDRDESFEDAGAHIRRRVPGTQGGDPGEQETS